MYGLKATRETKYRKQMDQSFVKSLCENISRDLKSPEDVREMCLYYTENSEKLLNFTPEKIKNLQTVILMELKH